MKEVWCCNEKSILTECRDESIPLVQDGGQRRFRMAEMWLLCALVSVSPHVGSLANKMRGSGYVEANRKKPHCGSNVD